MSEFFVSYGGSVKVEAKDEEAARRIARELASACVTTQPQQIGQEVDENGWTIVKSYPYAKVLLAPGVQPKRR